MNKIFNAIENQVDYIQEWNLLRYNYSLNLRSKVFNRKDIGFATNIYIACNRSKYFQYKWNRSCVDIDIKSYTLVLTFLYMPLSINVNNNSCRPSSYVIKALFFTFLLKSHRRTRNYEMRAPKIKQNISYRGFTILNKYRWICCVMRNICLRGVHRWFSLLDWSISPFVRRSITIKGISFPNGRLGCFWRYVVWCFTYTNAWKQYFPVCLFVPIVGYVINKPV